MTIVRLLKATLPALIAAAAITGCSKKAEPPAAVVAPAADTTPATAPAPAAPARATATSPIAPSTDLKKSYAEMDAALKAKAYEKAVQAMLAVQQQRQLTEQQAAEARAQMVGLQQNLAAAIASGDPNARAAADLLRRSAMAH
ncbi:MAG: hypothetical protein JF609_03035 [Verrucomicrobia bacterium]|nr:hypothetical protein [Verrucomicrobiota bacterium]